MIQRSLFFLLPVALTACIAEKPPTGDAPESDGATVDMGEPDLTLDGAPVRCRPQVALDPTRIEFPVTPAFDTRTQRFTLTNTGDCAWTIDRVTQTGDRAFRLYLNGIDVQVDLDALANPDGDGMPGVSPGNQVAFDVAFTPPDDRAYAANFVLRIDGDDYALSLTGNTIGRCLRLDPTVLEFTAPINGAPTADVLIENCGSEPLAVTAIELIGDGDAPFGLDPARIPELPAMLPGGRTEQVRVRFMPNRGGVFNASLRVVADGVAEQVVQIVGRAQENACPIAVTPPEVVQAEVGEAILLSGEQSRDPDGPDGRPVEWMWSVVESPDGAAFIPVEALFDNARPVEGGPADDPLTPEAIFVPPLPGRYVLGLTVVDANGLSSRDCDTDGVMIIEVGGPRGLLVQLTWQTPGDPDDDAGADVDLILRRGEFICSPAEPTPEWPPEGPRNDPVYTADDMAGGPENIIVADAVFDGMPWVVQARYDDDAGLGASIAMVRVFLDDQLIAEEQAELAQTGDQFEFEFILP